MADYLDISLKDICAFGDDINDIEMIEDEKADFLADQKGYGQRYLQMFKRECDGKE